MKINNKESSVFFSGLFLAALFGPVHAVPPREFGLHPADGIDEERRRSYARALAGLGYDDFSGFSVARDYFGVPEDDPDSGIVPHPIAPDPASGTDARGETENDQDARNTLQKVFARPGTSLLIAFLVLFLLRCIRSRDYRE